MTRTFTYDVTSDPVTFVRLRRAKHLVRGDRAWVGWVDGDAFHGFGACGYVSPRNETDPTKVVVKDGYLPCDTAEEAEAELARSITAKLAEGFTPEPLTTSAEPAGLLERIERSPAEAFSIAVELSTRYFESKNSFFLFWVEGRGVYRREGKLGTFSAATFEPEEDGAHLSARTAADRVALIERLVDKKRQAGFVEKPLPPHTAPSAQVPPHVEVWHALAAAKDPRRAFRDHFAFLAELPDDRSLLAALSDEVTSLSVTGGALNVAFGTGQKRWRLQAKAPWAKEFDKTVPASVRRFAEVHNGARLFDGPRVTVGFRGVSRGRLPTPDIEASWVEEADERLFSKFEAKDVSPTDVISRHDDYVILNPFKKTPAKEPQLLFISHEGGKPENVFGGEVGVTGAFLRYLGEDLLGRTPE